MTQALRDGMRDALAHWPSALMLFGAVTIPAGLAGYVFQTSFVSAFGRSSALDTLSEGFVYTTLFDLFTKEGFRIVPVTALSFGFLLVSLPVHSFLTAGLISALGEGRSWSSRAYFTGAARHTGGFILLSILTLAIALMIAALTLAAAGFLLYETPDAASPGVPAILSFGLVLGACVIMLGDYARIHLVQDPESGVFGSIHAALEFLIRNAGPAAALAFALAIASLIPLVGVVLFEDLVPRGVGGWLAPLVLIQQAAVMLRGWIRVFAFAAQSSFVRAVHGTLRSGEAPPAPSPFLTQGV